MEQTLTKLFEANNFSSNKIEKVEIDDSFIEKDSMEYFKETLYLNQSNNSYIYLFENFSERNSSFTITEFLKVSLKLKEKYKNEKISFFIAEKGEILEFEAYLKKMPISSDKYAPDFSYILSDLDNFSDENLKNSIKLKIFAEIIKFISKENELKELLSFFLKSQN